jgi:hypothetical protein
MNMKETMDFAAAESGSRDESDDGRPLARTVAKPAGPTHVPANVVAALDRMCTPLDKSWLAGATAEEDARCMALIRAFVLGASTGDTSRTLRKGVQPDFWREIDRIAGDFVPVSADLAVVALGEMRDALRQALVAFAPEIAVTPLEI